MISYDNFVIRSNKVLLVVFCMLQTKYVASRPTLLTPAIPNQKPSSRSNMVKRIVNYPLTLVKEVIIENVYIKFIYILVKNCS